YFSFSSFFFQAEDGIRDDLVTGVQTCALPICPSLSRRRARRSHAPRERKAPPPEETPHRRQRGFDGEGGPGHHSRLRHHHRGDRARLRSFQNLTITTNAVNITTELAGTDVEIILKEGTLRTNSFSVVGPIS